VSLPRHLLDVLDPAPPRLFESTEDECESVPMGTKAGRVAELNYERVIPPWWWTYPQDVPKR
jgi:hypothetical protein